MKLGNDINGAIQAGWQAISAEASGHGITEAQFVAWLAGWCINSIELDGETVGIWATRGARCHTAISPEAHGRWTRKLLRQMIAPQLAEFGRLETVATTETGREFIERIGFVSRGAEHILEHQI